MKYTILQMPIILLKKIGVTLDEATFDEKIARKNFFQLIYAASAFEKQVFSENEKSGATRG